MLRLCGGHRPFSGSNGLRHANATEELPMTDDMTKLGKLVEKTPDAGLLREMIGFAAQRLIELEVEGQTGAAYGEKTPERLAQRNGYRDRIWETRAGAVELRILKLRSGILLPGLPGAAPHGREGAHRRGAGSLRAGCLDPLGGRSGAGDGHDRHLQEPGQPAVMADALLCSNVQPFRLGGLFRTLCDLRDGRPAAAGHALD
jgi:hypothetical protein